MLTGVILTVEEAINDRLDPKYALPYEEMDNAQRAEHLAALLKTLPARTSAVRLPTDLIHAYRVTVPGSTQYWSTELALVEEVVGRRGGGRAAAAPAGEAEPAAAMATEAPAMGGGRAAMPADAASGAEAAAGGRAGRDAAVTTKQPATALPSVMSQAAAPAMGAGGMGIVLSLDEQLDAERAAEEALLTTEGFWAQFFSVVRGLHVRLMWGNGRIVGWLGMIGAVLGLVGIIVWWRYRRAFRWNRVLYPRRNTAADTLQNHMHGGLVASIFLLLFGLTGAFLGVRGLLNSAVVASEDATALEAQAIPITTPIAGAEFVSWEQLFANAAAALPEGAEITEVDGLAPTRTTATVHVRYSAPLDINPRGIGNLYLNPYTGEVIKEYGPAQMNALRWIATSYRSLHTGTGMPFWYILIVAAGSLVVGITTLSGVWAFFRRQFRLDKRPMRTA